MAHGRQQQGMGMLQGGSCHMGCSTAVAAAELLPWRRRQPQLRRIPMLLLSLPYPAQLRPPPPLLDLMLFLRQVWPQLQCGLPPP